MKMKDTKVIRVKIIKTIRKWRKAPISSRISKTMMETIKIHQITKMKTTRTTIIMSKFNRTSLTPKKSR